MKYEDEKRETQDKIQNNIMLQTSGILLSI